MALRHPAVRASFWMMGALASFMAMAVSGRELSTELGTFQILFVRSVIGLVIVSVLILNSGGGQIRTRIPGQHLVRNLAHFAGQFGWFYGIAYLSLAEVFAIEFTVPIWTAILATYLLGERMTWARLGAVALGVAGMLIILRPGLVPLTTPTLVVLGAALSFAVSHTLTRRLALVDPPLTILFYMSIIQLPMSLLPALDAWVNPSPALWPWLLVVGVTGLSAHYCMARALKLADATVVVPMDFMRLPLIALVGFLVYGEPLNIYVLAGAAVMLIGNLINVRAEQRPVKGKS